MLNSNDAMSLFGYRDREAFWKFVRREGVPHVRINQRVIRFEQGPVEDWIKRRRVGARRIQKLVTF